jgi:hypothetical protein
MRKTPKWSDRGAIGGWTQNVAKFSETALVFA